MLEMNSLKHACFAFTLLATSSLDPRVGSLSGDAECNGVVAEVPVEGPYPEMTCVNSGSVNSCSIDSMQLDTNTVLYWCECDPAGEPTCCHTIQKKIDGYYQVPTGWGSCRVAYGCGGGDCVGNAMVGFSCQ